MFDLFLAKDLGSIKKRSFALIPSHVTTLVEEVEDLRKGPAAFIHVLRGKAPDPISQPLTLVESSGTLERQVHPTVSYSSRL